MAHLPKQQGMGRTPRATRFLPILAVAVSALTVPAAAGAASGGGTAYDSSTARAAARRPVARVFSVSPRTVTLPALPTVRLRVDQRGSPRVSARLVFWPQGGGAVVARVDLGWVRTGRTLRVRWPSGMTVAPGRYLVRLHVKDRDDRTLARGASSSGRTVRLARPLLEAPRASVRSSRSLTCRRTR